MFTNLPDEKTFESLLSHATKLISMTLFHRGSYEAAFFDEEELSSETSPGERSDEDMLALLNTLIPDV